MISTIQLDGVEVTLADESAKQIWTQIAKKGVFRGHPAGPFELNERVFDDIIRNFKSTQNRAIPIDFEHASEADPTQGSIPTDGAPAQGWIRDLKIVDGSLFGLVEWGDKARDYIRAGQYRFFSPAIRFGARDRVTGAQVGARMTSGALTNNPFLDGMTPLAAKDQASNQAVEANRIQMDYEKLYAEAQDKITALTAEKGALSAKIEHLTGENASFSLSLKDASALKDTAEGELKTLRAWRDDREAKDITDRVSTAFETYKDAKKLSDADRDAMPIVLKTNPELFERLYPKVAPSQQHLLRNVSDTREVAAETVLDTPENESFSDATHRLMKDKKISFEAAQNLAFKQRQSR